MHMAISSSPKTHFGGMRRFESSHQRRLSPEQDTICTKNDLAPQMARDLPQQCFCNAVMPSHRGFYLQIDPYKCSCDPGGGYFKPDKIA